MAEIVAEIFEFGRYLILGKYGPGKIDFQVALFCNPQGIRQGLGNFPEGFRHLFLTFHVELIGVKAHPILFPSLSVGSYAEQDILGTCIGPIEIMDVVGCNQGDARFLRYTNQLFIDGLLFGNTVVLHFEEKVFFSKQLTVVVRLLLRLFGLSIHDH